MKKFPALFRRGRAIAALLSLCSLHTAAAGGEPPGASTGADASTAGKIPAHTLIPYTARYSVVKSGTTVGEAVYTLARAPGGWEFRARARPSKMVSLFVSTVIDEYSLLEPDGTTVRPLKYRFEQTTGDSRDGRILHADYDWQANTISVTDGAKNRRLPLNAGVHDPLSVQLAVVQCVKNDCGKLDYRVLDDLELQERLFQPAGAESLRTALGLHETVKLSYRSGKRETVTWLAPELHYIPVMVRQFRNGKLKSEMRIAAVDFE
jgi:hypothetical protein